MVIGAAFAQTSESRVQDARVSSATAGFERARVEAPGLVVDCVSSDAMAFHGRTDQFQSPPGGAGDHTDGLRARRRFRPRRRFSHDNKTHMTLSQNVCTVLAGGVLVYAVVVPTVSLVLHAMMSEMLRFGPFP